MKDLITEARELCKYSEKIVNQLHTERLDYELEYMPLIETIQVTSELCDALEKYRWIPVTEGLPEERQHENGEPIEFNVIISGAKVPTTLCFDGAEWRDFWKDGGYGPAYAVTHWMPPPVAPEEGAEHE